MSGVDPSYSAALSLAIKFLEVQQSGSLPSWNRVRRAAGGWRDNAHTWEGASISKDLSGGYYDGAHSYRMTLPTAFLVNNLAAALQMFGPVRWAATLTRMGLAAARWAPVCLSVRCASGVRAHLQTMPLSPPTHPCRPSQPARRRPACSSTSSGA